MRSQLKRTISVAGLALACLLVQAAALAQFSVIYSFGTGSPAGYYYPTFCLRIGKTLYGTTSYGGQYGNGTIFTMDTSGIVSVVHPFTNSDGSVGFCTMVNSGGWIYGAAVYGGANNQGFIFRMKPNGSLYSVLFTGSTDSTSTGQLFIAGVLNGVIYGSGQQGGVYGYGTVWSMRTDGSNFTLLHSFAGTDGIEPAQPTLVAPSRYTAPVLVGGAESGGSSDNGVIYRMNLDGSGFAVLHAFDGSDGPSPEFPQVLLGGMLFGDCRGGPSYNRGTVWKLDGTGFTVLHQFSGTDGADPCAQLLLNGTLYGQTDSTATSGTGEIYSIVPNGSGFTILHVFNPSVDGWGASSLKDYNGVLYGTASNGGVNGGGTAFKFVP